MKDALNRSSMHQGNKVAETAQMSRGSHAVVKGKACRGWSSEGKEFPELRSGDWAAYGNEDEHEKT